MLLIWTSLKFCPSIKSLGERNNIVFDNLKYILGEEAIVFNPLHQNPDFKRPRQKRHLKALWEKEKMLVTI